MKNIIIGSGILLLFNLTSFGQKSDLENIFNNHEYRQFKENSLPENNFIDIANGKTVVVASLVKGCKWILEEMAYYNKLKKEYSEKFDVFIMFSDDIETMSTYIQEVNFDFIYIYDPLKTMGHELFPSDTLYSVLFDSRGFIQDKTSSGKLNRDKILEHLNKNQIRPELNTISSLPFLNFQLKRYNLGDGVSSNLNTITVPTKIMTGYKANESIDTVENIKICTISGENILGLYSYAYNLPKNRFIYDKEIIYIDSHAPNQRYTLSLSVSNLHSDFNKMLIKQVDLNFGLETSPIKKKTESLVLSQIDLEKGGIKISNSLNKNNTLNKTISETKFQLKADNIKAAEISRLIEEKVNVPVELYINPSSNYSVDISIENNDRSTDNWIKLFSENGLIIKKEIKEVEYVKIKNGSR